MQLKTEENQVLRCVRNTVCEETPCIDGTLDLDWSLVSAIAKRHEVQPFVFEAVENRFLSEPLPKDVRDELLLDYHRTGMRNEFIERHVGDILREVTGRGIEVMLLKGAVLAFHTYARPEHRGLGDVDLLIRERDFRGLRDVLEGFGYRASLPELSVRDLPRYAQSVSQVRFQSPTVPPIEVHFRLLNTGVPSETEPAWDDPETILFGGATVGYPSPERFLLHLCLHAQQHAFAVLRLLVDIALWHRSQTIDVNRFVALAQEHRLRTAAYNALTYTADLIGLPASEPLRRRLRPPAWKQRMFEYLWHDRQVRALSARLGAMEAELPRAFLLGEASMRDKAAFLWTVLMPPVAWLGSVRGSPIGTRLRHLGRVVAVGRRGLFGVRAVER